MSDENLIKENERLVADAISSKKLNLILGVALCISGFSSYYMATNQVTTLIPPGMDLKAKTKVSRTGADNEYLQQMADHIILNAMIVTPADVSSNLQRILYLVAPEYYGTYAAELETQAQYIKNNNITQSFAKQKIEFKNKKIIVYGLLSRSIGESDAPRTEAVVVIGYSFDNGKFMITSLTKYDKKKYMEVKNKVENENG